jgi:hypothetical protein
VAAPQRMAHLSARNLGKAQEYRDEVLNKRRVAFYTHVRQATHAWLAGRYDQARSTHSLLQGIGGFQ